MSARVFWANSGLGLASAPDFWKVVHSGRVTVHRTEITGFADHNKVLLKNKEILETDQVVLCTGWTDNLGLFDESTRMEWGLPSAADLGEKWTKLDAAGDKIVLEKLPFLKKNAPDTTTSSSHKRPWRLYRRLISPSMAAKGDRSVFFPGQIHSVYTPLVAEMQALWGVAFLLGRLDIPDHEEMEKEVAVWCAWTRRRYFNPQILFSKNFSSDAIWNRYLEQGRRHSYSIYDYLAVSHRVISHLLFLSSHWKSLTYTNTVRRHTGPRSWSQHEPEVQSL